MTTFKFSITFLATLIGLTSYSLGSGSSKKFPTVKSNTDDPNPLRNLYFGEQHLHSYMSPDAFAAGTRLKPEDAYRWAMGLPIKKSETGEIIQKATPYDFVALTDHAEYLGVFPHLLDPSNKLAKTKLGKMINSGDKAKMNKAAYWTIDRVAKIFS